MRSRERAGAQPFNRTFTPEVNRGALSTNHVFGMWEEAGVTKRIHTGTGRTCQLHTEETLADRGADNKRGRGRKKKTSHDLKHHHNGPKTKSSSAKGSKVHVHP